MSAYVMHIHPALERGHESVDNVGRHFFFAFQRIDHGIGPADNGYFIRVMTEARPWVVQRIEHDEVEILPFQFFVRMRRLVMGFEGKAYEFLSLTFHLAERLGYVACRFQTEDKVIGFAFDFAVGSLRRREVGHGCT